MASAEDVAMLKDLFRSLGIDAAEQADWLTPYKRGGRSAATVEELGPGEAKNLIGKLVDLIPDDDTLGYGPDPDHDATFVPPSAQ